MVIGHLPYARMPVSVLSTGTQKELSSQQGPGGGEPPVCPSRSEWTRVSTLSLHPSHDSHCYAECSPFLAFTPPLFFFPSFILTEKWQLCVFMECNMMFCYMYILWNDLIRQINISSTFNIYLLFSGENISLLSIWRCTIHYYWLKLPCQVLEHWNLFFLSNEILMHLPNLCLILLRFLLLIWKREWGIQK